MNYLLDKAGLQQVVAGLKAYVDDRGGEAASIDIADITSRARLLPSWKAPCRHE